MRLALAFGLVCFAWIACVICYTQFMTWYDGWCRRHDRTPPFDRLEDHE